ncbi:MAG: universal stress protein [Coriobacteriia bacterium]|nr:universal stress protein [Coriobacteriia bacterium]
MLINNILVPYDGSECANHALELACDIAKPNPDARIEVVTVVQAPHLSAKAEEEFAEVLRLMDEHGKETLEKAMEALDPDLNDQVQTFILKGPKPGDEIIKLTKERDYDLIVIGSRGLNGMKEYLGSVSHKVLNAVSVPVLVAR